MSNGKRVIASIFIIDTGSNAALNMLKAEFNFKTYMAPPQGELTILL